MVRKAATSKTTAKAKKPAAKKTTTTKRATARKTATAKKVAAPSLPTTAITQKETKTQTIRRISEETGIAPKDVKAVLEALGSVIHRHVGKRGSGELNIPMLGIKVRRVRKKATKARDGRNPITGETIRIAAKPAQNVVRLRALKDLKEAID